MPSHTASFKDRVEYGGVLILEGLFRVLPYRFCVGLAWMIACFAFHVLRWRRREAERRIRSVLGVGASEARKIAWQSLRNSALTAGEILYGRAVRDSWIHRHVDGWEESLEKFKAASAPGRGIVLALPHFGNWYLAGSVMAHYGVPLFAVAGVQRNPLTNDWMNRRLYGKMKIFERGSSALRQCVKSLRSGGVLAILPDVRMKTPDLTVRFLGGDANLGRGMAAFARRTGSPIVLAKIRRVGLSRHVFDIAEPLFPDESLDEETDIRRLTETVMALIEAQIRADPGQWFWYNKRWVLDPLTV
jgi:KDO2-lipid IV(A) lauroyltransferase